MSLPGSPHSLSGDDFAVLLDFKLQAGSDCDEKAENQGSEEECENEVKELAKQNARCPPHPGFMWDVCIRCGAQKAASETGEAGVALRYIHEGLEVTNSEAARLRSDELGKLKERKKLYLVLDLDHTLLNSAQFVEVPPEEEAYCTSAYSVQASSGGKTQCIRECERLAE